MNQKDILCRRSDLMSKFRQCFFEKKYIEVQTPSLRDHANLEPYLDPYEVREENQTRYLITSPEHALKRILGMGVEKVFEFSHAFRSGEKGSWHTREFSLIEWYEIGASYEQFRQDCIELLIQVGLGKEEEWECISVQSWLEKHAQVGMSREDWRNYLSQLGLKDLENWSNEDLFFKIFLPTETQLAQKKGVILYDYPEELAAYAQIQEGRAKRFEIYWKGIELANAYLEEGRPQRVRQSIEHWKEQRKELGKTVFPEEEEFIQALGNCSETICGIAMGFDRVFACIESCELHESSPFNFLK